MNPERLKEIETLVTLGVDARTAPYRQAIKVLLAHVKELVGTLEAVRWHNVGQARIIRDGMPEVRDEAMKEACTRAAEDAAGVCSSYADDAECMSYEKTFANGNPLTQEDKENFLRDSWVARELAKAIRDHFAIREAARYATDANGTTHKATAIYSKSFNTKCGLKESLLMSFSVEGSTDNREVWCAKCFEDERKAAHGGSV